MYFCHRCRSAKIPCRRTPFQQFENNDGMPHWLHTAGLASGCLQARTNGNQKGVGSDLWVGGRERASQPAVRANSLYAQTVLCRLAEWPVSSLDVCHAVHDAALAVSAGNEWRWDLPCGKTSKNTFSIPKDSFHGLLVFRGWCRAIPFHALSFCFRMKAVESVFVISDNAVRKTYRSSNCNETFLFKLTFMLRLKAKDPAGTNFPIPQTFHSLVKRTVPHFNFRCHFSVNAPIRVDKLAGLSVVSRGSGNSRAGRSTLTTLPSLQTVLPVMWHS